MNGKKLTYMYIAKKKQSLKNHRPISLLPTCNKIFEHLIYNKVSIFFTENNLVSPNKSGFRHGDSCVNQSPDITCEIHKLFDVESQVWGVFLDISAAFDKIWSEGLIVKLNQNSISGNLLKLLCEFLSCQKQWVVLNGQHSSLDNATAVLPQDPALGPLLFLIYINDVFPHIVNFLLIFSVVNNILTSSINLSQT